MRLVVLHRVRPMARPTVFTMGTTSTLPGRGGGGEGEGGREGGREKKEEEEGMNGGREKEERR